MRGQPLAVLFLSLWAQMSFAGDGSAQVKVYLFWAEGCPTAIENLPK